MFNECSSLSLDLNNSSAQKKFEQRRNTSFLCIEMSPSPIQPVIKSSDRITKVSMGNAHIFLSEQLFYPDDKEGGNLLPSQGKSLSISLISYKEGERIICLCWFQTRTTRMIAIVLTEHTQEEKEVKKGIIQSRIPDREQQKLIISYDEKNRDMQHKWTTHMSFSLKHLAAVFIRKYCSTQRRKEQSNNNSPFFPPHCCGGSSVFLPAPPSTSFLMMNFLS